MEMSGIGNKTALLIAIPLLVAPAWAAAESSTLVALQPESAMWLRGSTNIHHWRCRAGQIVGGLQLDATYERVLGILAELELEEGRLRQSSELTAGLSPQMSFQVPVRSLECGSTLMERDLRRAVDAEQYPSIAYKFVRLNGFNVGPAENGFSYGLNVSGELTLAGVTRPVVVAVTAERKGRNRIRIRGEAALQMTEFEVTPPRALFGLIRAHDEFIVQVNLVFTVIDAPVAQAMVR